ncbi:MAG: biotin-dependent carboxyltransferase family protein [Tissierellia bacterium]|nr:biotin-dependent carboxyltransferase family protein [Tissierellia bacterium]
MSSIKVKKGGFLTTVQDLGRIGYQKFGMPVAGAMDNFSYRVANFLVGNKESEAVLEATLLGPELEFGCDMSFAVTGANMKPVLNGKEIPMWESYKVTKGDILSLGVITSGLRAYIAFSGSIEVPLLNNSKSTYLKTGIGGFKGRKILNDDELEIKVSDKIVSEKFIEPKYIPEFKRKGNVRVVLGPQDDYFTEEGINTFLSTDGYKITKEADCMGYRLGGKTIKHMEKADIISDGALFGSVQVPANGLPIILMADRQTAGGYTKIATVISTDLPMLAQMGEGSELVFEKITLEEAHKLYKEYEEKLSEIKAQIENSQRVIKAPVEKAEYVNIGPVRKMNIVINGVNYVVDVQEIQ